MAATAGSLGCAAPGQRWLHVADTPLQPAEAMGVFGVVCSVTSILAAVSWHTGPGAFLSLKGRVLLASPPWFMALAVGDLASPFL